MKKLFLLLLLLGGAYIANAQYVVEGRGTYTVNQKFLSEFSNHIMNQRQELRPFLTEIYYSLKAGNRVEFNPMENSITGVSFSNLFTREELNKQRTRYIRNPNREATKNTKYHRLCVALSTLNHFYPSNSLY